ncbi:MAG TPA: efflux RND transporter permease subunit [candidate division Zixibacteria bacterium]|nr:efflux RND transporter permease subunit [candidate division Zixibacteria bacterium]HEQ98753.1 efflux RND transporter permease subunit [candidate division Zixibacteria bacterium]
MKIFFELILKNRLIILILLIGVIILGTFQYKSLPTDAFPDISPIMVPVFAEAHGMAPEEIERLITFPIESTMNGLPGVTMVKSTSAFGMAVVYVYFEDDVDIYFARQIVAERLAGASGELPDMNDPPALGPISTGLGEVFMYYLTADSTIETGGKPVNTYLRELNDWVIKYQLQTVPGVTKILSMGGHVLQYQIEINPYALNKYELGLDDIVDAISNNNRNAGGQFLVLGSEEYLVRGIGLLETRDDLRNIQLKVVSGIPVRLGDVAEVDFGREIRRGVVTRNGEQEVVAGIVMKLFGTNTSDVIKNLNQRIPEVQGSLPQGVHLVPYYNQNALVNNAIHTVRNALFQGALLVIIVLALFLGNARSALIVALALPVCALISAIFMSWAEMSANLMSLGGIAIAIGMLGDASIVIVENIYRLLGDQRYENKSKFEIIVAACTEVARPIIFSVSIIIIVFLPLFTLEGVEGKMFSPMAFTITFALLGSIIAALMFSPVLASLLLKKGHRKEFFFLGKLKLLYRPFLMLVLSHRVTVVVTTLLIFAGTLLLLPFLGTEFIPTLEEGTIQINVTMAPSISLVKATETIMKLERIVMGFDGVEQTVSKIGRPEAGSHPHPVNSSHIQVMLKPQDEWQRFHSKEELVEALNEKLSDYPGIQLVFSQPIQNMFDELLSGVKTQLAIKLYGEDLKTLRSKAEEIKEVIEPVEGLVDLSTEQSFGQPQVQIVANRDACARYGVDISEILSVVELAVGGEVISQVFLNTRRFGIQVRFDERYRNKPESIRNILVHSSDGVLIPLSHVATIETVIGPIQINREKNQRRWVISGNVRGRDMGSVVGDIKKLVRENIELPYGYYLEYGGQFENQERAMRRLSIIVPVTFLLIFLLLYMSLGNIRSATLIFINVPLALIGGVLGLFITGEYLSVPASVGFIALFGIAVQNGLVLVSYINHLRRKGLEIAEAVIKASMLRLRPVMMTALTTILGLVPLLLSGGMGSEVQRPLAVVVVFGLISSTFLTLVLIPALYKWFAPRLTTETD